MRKILILFLVTIHFISCNQSPKIPRAFSEKKDAIKIFPDYTDIIIPPNIAPMNFRIEEDYQKCIVSLKSDNNELIAAGDKNGIVKFPEEDWKHFLNNNTGKPVQYTIYAFDGKQWFSYPSFTNHIAMEKIDPYLSYRLIEPGYETYRNLGIYQRDLQNFKTEAIYENNRIHSIQNDHCINCHHFQSGKTERMLFHIRQNHGGTIITNGKNIKKVNTKTDSTIAAAVYPAWHPTLNKVVFSVNHTGQAFHILGQEKVEVMDEASDLVWYDAEKDIITPIINDKMTLETYPAWNPTGDTLYYCAANPGIGETGKEENFATIVNKYDSIWYDIMAIPYDISNDRFGTPDTVFPASLLRKSATLPRVSPNGRYLLFTLADYGQFHIWHKSSDLYLIDFHQGAIRPLSNANSMDAESYHSWSSNGRWIVFSSRRDDGSYTRPYFTYLTENGNDSKAFILPLEDPEDHIRLFKSYNIPEFTTEPVKISAEEFKEVVYRDAKPVTFKSKQ